MRRARQLALSVEEWDRLRALIIGRATPTRIKQRARIVIEAALGRPNRDIARSLGVDVATVALWRRRFEAQRFERELRDAPRRGRRSTVNVRTAERILHATFHIVPLNGQRWTTRTLARFLGVNHMQVHRIWKTSGVDPGRVPGSGPTTHPSFQFPRPGSSIPPVPTAVTGPRNRDQ